MIQRCPNCGIWCSTEEKGFFGRASRGFEDAAVAGGVIGSKIGGLLGSEKAGAIVGGGVVGGTGIAPFNAITEAFFGDKYKFICPNCGFEWSTDDEDEDQTEDYEHEQAVIKIRDHFPSIVHSQNSEKQQYIKDVRTMLASGENTEVQSAVLYDILAAAYYSVGDRNNALQAANSSLKLFDDYNTRILKGLIMGKGRNAQDTYAAMQEVIHYKNEERTESPYIPTPQIEETFSMLQTSFAQGFLTLPFQQRKHLVVCDELVYLPNSFRALPITEVPTDLIFPVGHPVSNTLYVCHPYKTNYYYPYDMFEVEILRDEIEEFKTIMDNLGARHIDFSDMYEKGEATNQHQKQEVHAGGDYAGKYNVKANYEAEDGNELCSKLRSTWEGSEDFLLAGKPTLPQNSVWYGHRIEWQHKCESRLAGRLVHTDFTISTSSSEMTTESERKGIEADMKILLASVKGGAERSKSYMLKREKERTWKVNVDFYPLSDYDKKQIVAPHLLGNDALNAPLQASPKKFNIVWIMGVIIAVLIAVIVGLLFF